LRSCGEKRNIFIHILIYFHGAHTCSRSNRHESNPHPSKPHGAISRVHISRCSWSWFLQGKRVKGAIGGAVSFVPEHHAEFFETLNIFTQCACFFIVVLPESVTKG
jgi:hypothetical protein